MVIFWYTLFTSFLLIPIAKGTRFLSVGNRYPTVADYIEASELSSGIVDARQRYIVEQQLLYCPSLPMCSNLSRTVSDGDYFGCCDFCSCRNNDPVLGGQCPDVGILSASDNIFSCLLPQYMPFHRTKVNTRRLLYMIEACSPNFTNHELIDRCILNSENLDLYDLSLFTPVSTSENNFVYKNRFCALCNNVTEDSIYSWDMQLLCSSDMPFVIPPSTQLELLQILQDTGACNIIFFNDNLRQESECHWGVYNECNQTGLWTKYNETIDQACKSYTSLYMGIYRNVFCYMCNTNQLPVMGCTKEEFPERSSTVFGAFTGIIRYRNKADTPTDSRCSENEVYDPHKEVCRRVYCPLLYYYNEVDNTCNSIFDTTSNLQYEVYYKVINPLSTTCATPNCLRDIANMIKNALISDITSQLYPMLDCMFHSPFWYIPITDNLTTIEYIVIKLIFARLDAHDDKYYVNELLSVSHVYIHNDNQTLSIDVDLLSKMAFQSDTILQAYPYFPVQDTDNSICSRFHMETIDVLEFYFCPRIKVDMSEVKLSKDEAVLKNLNISVSLNYVIDNGSNVFVCLDHYLNKTHRPKNQTSDPEGDIIEEILSAVCSLTSIISLIMTLTVYLFFKELRTTPGRITLYLSIHLLIAHILYLFGINATYSENLCFAIGIMIHFFWIESIMWMHVCSIHMFRVFFFLGSSPNTNHSRGLIAVYYIYALCVSCIFVGINILYNVMFSKSNVGYLGYGGVHCYITEPTMILFTFALPSGCILLSNIILFLLSVYKIERLPDVNSDNMTNRNTFNVYIKLTCLTGATWVFGFLYQWTLITGLSYIFIVLNASQGLFIFLSFACNERVRKLCRTKWCHKDSQINITSVNETSFSTLSKTNVSAE